MVFYSFAGLALLWLPFWLPVVTLDKFRSQPSSPISSMESDIEASASTAVAPTASTGATNGSSSTSVAPVDSWALLKRREVWAICGAQYAQSWGMYGLLNWLPTFFSEFYQVGGFGVTVLRYAAADGRAGCGSCERLECSVRMATMVKMCPDAYWICNRCTSCRL